MALRQGDRLSLTRDAVVWLSQYDSLKPRVTLTRELGEDPEADREDMERTLYVELRRALLFEIRDRRAMGKHYDEANARLTPLIKHCEEVVRDGEEGEQAIKQSKWPHEEKGDGAQGSGQARRGSRKKATSRKKASRRGRS